ncbi:DUF59 domain-containing protein [Candidatus Woesearchaeota archaeon]|nr:DUF59 domain-containing protein [Candidatus Woesearchaeota archaeon]
MGRRQVIPDYGNIQSGNIQSGNIQSGNIQSGNIQSGNIQSGNIQYGNIQKACLRLLLSIKNPPEKARFPMFQFKKKSEKSVEKSLTKEDAIEAMKNVMDPELRLDVWTLGLIYGVEVKEQNAVSIKMTFTTPACPYAPQLVADLKGQLMEAGFQEPEIEYVFDPPWAPSDEVKMLLGLM